MGPKSQRSREIPACCLAISWNPTEWTGDELQKMLSFLCFSSLCLGCLILVHEILGWPSDPVLPKCLTGDLSVVKYFYFACAVFTFTWYLYDVFIYNPYYCRASERRSSARTSRQRDTSRNYRAVPSFRSTGPVDSGPNWPMPELEPGHPLVEGLRDLRELALATSYRWPLERFGDGSMPQNKRRRVSLWEYAESRFY